ncbi:toxin-activating lysine-acyltransferase [Agrobacterium larrymoorei]|uniref:RTX toxin-activating lysine-acyltransferase n=1 Tax=Agrobacterium larrymoorei TaxID=160699 RepID=A0AAF0HA37_9HYPH|nr:toxin-activating lysine-acyltransferase [Agrobacterium larrymoorei]WHA43234.1 toxin-activating lysine-acyltransferase [Agrobacterium larrymoorei]
MRFVEGAPEGRFYGFYEIFGMMIAISLSSHYRTYRVEDIASYLIPPLDARQFKVYLDDDGKPASFVTWALVNDTYHQGLKDHGDNPPPDQWTSGEHLWFTDLVTVTGDVRPIVRDIRRNLFPDRNAYSIRRNENGGIGRICLWRNARI